MADRPRTSPLTLDAETMRRTGYAVVDAMVAWADQPDPVIRRADRATMAGLLPPEPPEAALGIDEVLARLDDTVFAHASKVGHPGYFAYIPGSTTWPSALADFMASVANVYCGSWMEAAGPSHVELVVLEWFRAWLGLPEGADGVLVSGGSAANLTALAAARELRVGAMDADVVVYCADQAHSSVGRAARALGFRPDQVRIVPSDEHFRLRPDALRTAIAADVAAGRRPLAVVAAAGSTNTGAVDPLDELADLCAETGAWLHVDAAYGGFASLTERGRALLAGIGRADSVTLDPHKWLFMPMECGAVLLREPGALERAFAVLPDYLADAHGDDDEVDFSDRGLQLTRGARAAKVWAGIATFGVGAYRDTVDRALDLALLAEHLVGADDDLELLNPATLGIVCFRRTVPGLSEDALARVNGWLMAELEATGRAMVSSTRLHGRAALRMCVLNHLTDEDDVRWTLQFLARTPVPSHLLAEVVTDDTALASAALTPQGRATLSARGFARSFAAGEPVVSRWATDRDFYVVLAGRLAVRLGEDTVSELGPGDFFGEIAASDWGSGYGYLRTADVVATTATTVLMVPREVLADLLESEPDFRARVMAVRAQRLTRM